MSNFVTDGTALPFPKADLGGLPGGTPSVNGLTAAEWNTTCQAVEDLRTVVLAGIHPPLLFELWTDSNGMGPATDASQDDPADAVATPNNNVTLIAMYASGFAEPVTPVNMGTGALRLETSTSPAHGPELAIGKALNEILNGPGSVPDAAHKVWIDKFAIHSTLISQWQQGSTAGNASPLLGGGNLDADSNARALSAVATSGRQATCAFIMLGTNEGSDATASSNAGTNTTALIARKRAVLGSALMIVWVVPQTTIPIGTYPNKVAARANQLAALQAATGIAIVFAEDLPTGDDLVHFVSIAEQVLGARMSFAYVRLAGLRERIVTAPTVVGVSPATYNGSAHGLSGITGASGTDLRAFPWQGSAHADLMFLPIFKGTVGAGSAIPTPSGWTSAIQVTNTDAATVENRAALFFKTCLQAELDGNNGFPLSPTSTPGGAQFALKPFTVRVPAGLVAALDGSPTSFTHTTLDTTPVTAAGVTTTAANRTICIMVFAWENANGQSFTVTNSNLTGLTQVFGASYPSSSGNYLFIGLWTGTLVAQGASGNSTVTPSAAASSCGFTWAM
jgi:hypothetical protein